MEKSKKFDSFTESIICKNENDYGKELKEKYSYDAIGESNGQSENMTQEEYEVMKIIEGEIIKRLEAAVTAGIREDCLEAAEIAEQHKKWLMLTGHEYTVAAHLDAVRMYVTNPQFTAYYDKNVKGCAMFLKNAVEKWLGK
ncbi:MAG TPA: hypothetical protein DIC60_02030 [Lachnospiraceae bacterium]|nr:hypothetical protein [Lachnospiraceae bacterium]